MSRRQCAWRATGPVLAVHGGAGRILPAEFSPEQVASARAALGRSLTAGMAVVRDGGTALDAVVAAVVVLEDDEWFNAGRGTVLTCDGGVELDAAVADGGTRRAGAVACVRGIRNPVRAARVVLERTPHVLLSGAGAESLARREGLASAPVDWFVTPRRRAGPRGDLGDGGGPEATGGTVGAVALDGGGHLAAATSTGGTTGQLPGRVGDSPLIGAGTWADDATCAVSATGDGEALMRAVFTHEADALVRLAGMSLGDACHRALDEVTVRGGTGGCVAVGADGTVTMPFTSPGMFRGWTDTTGVQRTGLFHDDLNR